MAPTTQPRATVRRRTLSGHCGRFDWFVQCLAGPRGLPPGRPFGVNGREDGPAGVLARKGRRSWSSGDQARKGFFSMAKNIYVGNLTWDTTADDLLALFQEH